MTRPRLLPAMLCAGLLAACASSGPRSGALSGTWQGVSDNAKGTSFVFQPDGRVTWHLGQTFELEYKADAASTPSRLDLSGFTSGPLAGRTLLCIYELEDPGRLRLDCEPSRAGVDDEAVRPKAFEPEQAQVFERASVGPQLGTEDVRPHRGAARLQK